MGDTSNSKVGCGDVVPENISDRQGINAEGNRREGCNTETKLISSLLEQEVRMDSHFKHEINHQEKKDDVCAENSDIPFILSESLNDSENSYINHISPENTGHKFHITDCKRSDGAFSEAIKNNQEAEKSGEVNSPVRVINSPVRTNNQRHQNYD